MMSDLTEYDISHDEWREYDFNGRIYRIESPKKLLIRPGGSTHRVVDAEGITHCAPAPGTGDCVLRWKNPAGMGAKF
jgi:hypothetical protein